LAGLAVAITGVRDAPGLDPRNMQWVAKVAPVLRFDQPGGLTGGTARLSATAGCAVALSFAIAMIRIKKFAATQALTLSCLRHDRS
jgi:hypothetical protein